MRTQWSSTATLMRTQWSSTAQALAVTAKGADCEATQKTIRRADVQSFTNVLCGVLNAVVLQATGAAGEAPHDFECCQCYMSVLPETGHTDDVQLGALGAMDHYGGAKLAAPPVPARRRLVE